MTKALFLDRDGVINIDHGYVHKPDNFDFVDGIFELCQTAIQAGYIIVVVTNQAGIARGYYTEAEFAYLSNWMTEQFAKRHIEIAKVYYCPHHPDKGEAPYRQDCLCRKPKPGMLLQAIDEFSIDVSQSVMIGDKESDMLAAKNALVATRVLIQSRYHQQNNSDNNMQHETHIINQLNEISALEPTVF